MDHTTRTLLSSTRYRRDELGLPPTKELTAVIFVSSRHDKLLFVPMYYNQAHTATQDKAEVLPFSAPLEEVGYCARKAVLEFDVRPWTGPRHSRPRTESPIVILSGAKTLREFDRDFTMIHLESMAGGAIHVSEGRTHSDDPKDGLRIHGYISESQHDAALGDLIMELYHRAQYMKSCPKRPSPSNVR